MNNKVRTKKTFSQYKKSSLPVGDVLSFQNESYESFLQRDLKALFSEFFPIVDSNERFSISFVSCKLEEPRITAAEAKTKFINYSAPFRVELLLENKITKKKKKEEVVWCDMPIMTPQKTFIINGIERTIVSQMVRSQGVRFFTEVRGKNRNLFNAQVIPQKGKGVWVIFESNSNGTMFVRVDHGKVKMPVSVFIRAFGPETKEEVLKLFKGDEQALDMMRKTFDADDTEDMDEVWVKFCKSLRTGSAINAEKAKQLVLKKFSSEWYDMGELGRISFNKKFKLPTDAKAIKNRVLTIEDIVLIIKEIARLNNTEGAISDDIDHLGSRRVRSVGELVYEFARTGFIRMRKNTRDKMLTIDPKMLELPTNALHLRTFQSTIHGFFNTNQLSHTLNQENALAELENMRTLSALGPGGVSREHASISVRDMHRTHYGRICPLHSPDGANIGLVLHLAMYAKINKYGLLECPYFKVVNGKVTDEVEYLTASEEEQYRIAGADFGSDDNKEELHLVRHLGQYDRVDRKVVDYTDVSMGQILSISAALIPFIHNTLPVRGGYGAKMQKQTVPCVKPEVPLVSTGHEKEFIKSLSRVLFAEESGEVIEADANHIKVKTKNGIKSYALNVFALSGSAHTFANHQRVSVSVGQKVKKGDVLADTASTVDGNLAIGKNLRVAFIPYDGGTFEDSIIISERLVREDTLTSIQVKEHVAEIRETKLGPDIMTSDIPNVSDRKLRNLDAEGIIRIGSDVVPGDILVGKLTPRGEVNLSAEEKLLQSIFGDKSKDMRDTSKSLPPGEKGKVVSVQVRDREDGHGISNGVIKQIRIVVADLRHIRVGDKLANRYGNKGVISRVAPVEDMPFTKDGEPIDIILSSLGVPSRKNLGQILEMHLGLAAHTLDYQAVIPPMTSVTEDELKEELVKAGYPETGRVELLDGKTGEKFAGGVSIGYIYIMKLEHMVQDKIHARSTGRYSLITQQPPGGRAKFGANRLGEMEVWALLGHGASYTLREMLTIKSDDMQGRNSAYKSIIKNEPITQIGTPATFNVLLYHLRGLGLNVSLDFSEGDLRDFDKGYTSKKRTIKQK